MVLVKNQYIIEGMIKSINEKFGRLIIMLYLLEIIKKVTFRSYLTINDNPSDFKKKIQFLTLFSTLISIDGKVFFIILFKHFCQGLQMNDESTKQ